MKDYTLHTIRLEDYSKLKYYYELRRNETADSNLLNLYLWKDYYPTCYFTNEHGLMWVAKGEDSRYYSSVPCCRDEHLKLCFIETQKYFNEKLHKKLTMYLVDKKALELLELDEKDYVIIPDRTYYDYIYDAKKMQTFSGSKYHKKKNHLNAFKKAYEGRYRFEILTDKEEQEILTFLNQWKDTKINAAEHEFIDGDLEGIQYILKHYDLLEYKIGGVYIDDILEAVTIGNYYEQEDMVYIPVEKANSKYRGLYQYLCSEFLKTAYPDASKINREDDMGLEGLRHSKQSYHPIYMVEKYTVIQK